MLTVIGIGNVLRGDDGIGPHIISELQKQDVPNSIRLIDIGSDTFSIIEHLVNEDPVLVIDCAQMNKNPGDVFKFKVSEKNLSYVDNTISLHGFGFSELYKIAEKLNDNILCTIIGIQPKSLEFNTGLSDEIKKNIPYIKSMVIEEINNHVKKNINN